MHGRARTVPKPVGDEAPDQTTLVEHAPPEPNLPGRASFGTRFPAPPMSLIYPSAGTVRPRSASFGPKLLHLSNVFWDRGGRGVAAGGELAPAA